MNYPNGQQFISIYKLISDVLHEPLIYRKRLAKHYDATTRRVRVTPWKSNKYSTFWVCVCSRLYNLYQKFLFWKELSEILSQMYIRLHVKYPLPVILVRFLMKLEFSWQIFDKNSNIKIHKNPSGGRGGGFELFHTDGRTDMTKLIVDFRNFSNAPKNSLYVLMRMSGCKSGAEENHVMTSTLLNHVCVWVKYTIQKSTEIRMSVTTLSNVQLIILICTTYY